MVITERVNKGFGETVFALVNSKIVEVNLKEMLKKYKVYSITRIHNQEFENIDINKKTFTHFNLQNTKHEIGKKYMLIPIVDRTKDNEPVLNFEKGIIVKCIYISNFVNINHIEDFFLPTQ